MDPNATLQLIREQQAKIRMLQMNVGAKHRKRKLLDAYADLDDLVGIFDGWLSSGGFLPAAWLRTEVDVPPSTHEPRTGAPVASP